MAKNNTTSNGANLGFEQKLWEMADNLRISPAIVIGRVRWERQDYRRHNQLVGRNKVLKMFGGFEVLVSSGSHFIVPYQVGCNEPVANQTRWNL